MLIQFSMFLVKLDGDSIKKLPLTFRIFATIGFKLETLDDSFVLNIPVTEIYQSQKCILNVAPNYFLN